ncbi:unnamed protein product [marine sediment metagenome]|uniref:Uncharacterized protein n=1 Tax=marine sediment metagenome TaxID=412755 RepID=X1PJF0_9ZZZZ
MAKGKCTHHWIIDSEDIGVCKHCGEVKDFGKLQRKVDRHAEFKTLLSSERAKGIVRNPYGRRGKPLQCEDEL